jgi:hypothetical protein
MPFGALAHVGLGKETTWGTAAAVNDYIRFASEGITEEIEQVVSENIAGIVDEGASYEGMHNISGDLSFDVYPNAVGHMLQSAFGAPVTTSVSEGVYKHVFTPVQANYSNLSALPSYTLEIHRDLEQAFQYVGSVVNDLTFSFGTDTKIMQGSAAIISKELTLVAKTTPNFEATNPFLWHQAKVTINGVNNTDIQTLSFGVNNSLEGRSTLNQKKEISRIQRNGKRVFPVSFTLDLNNLDEYNRFRSQSEVSAIIELTGADIDGTNNHSLKIEIPKLRYNAFPINVGGSETITASVEGSAKYDSASAHAMKITLTNTKQSY